MTNNKQLDIEEWKDIPDFPGYQASNHGRIRSWLRQGKRPKKLANSPHILKQSRRGPKNVERLYVSLCKDNKIYGRVVHRLILRTFIGLCPDGMETCHNDGDKDNNHLSNLRWDTHIANEQDKIRHGTLPYKEKNGMAKLTEEQVIQIRNQYEQGMSTGKLAKIFNVQPPAIGRIVTGQRWATASGPIHKAGEHKGKRSPKGKDNWFAQHPEISQGSNNKNALLDEEKVNRIRQLAKQGKTATELSKLYGVGTANIYHILTHRSWKHVP